MFTLKESVTGAVQILIDTLMCKEPEGEKTGFSEFDNLMRGMRRGSLIVLVSRPAQGKTSFALNIANRMITRIPSRPVLYCSALCNTELAFRLLSIASGEDCSYDIDHGADGIKRLTATVNEIADRPLYFMDSRAMDETLFREVAEGQAETHFGLVIFDPVRAEHLPRLKKLAQELEVPILALMSVKKRDLHIKELDAADAVITLHRYRGAEKSATGTAIADISVIRNRHGMCGTCRMYFTQHSMCFREEIEEIRTEEA